MRVSSTSNGIAKAASGNSFRACNSRLHSASNPPRSVPSMHWIARETLYSFTSSAPIPSLAVLPEGKTRLARRWKSASTAAAKSLILLTRP